MAESIVDWVREQYVVPVEKPEESSPLVQGFELFKQEQARRGETDTIYRMSDNMRVIRREEANDIR